MLSKLQLSDFVVYKKNADKKSKSKDALILQSLSATFESGKLNAIMGPNGSGKTTMLAALYGTSDKQTKTAGSITLDGRPRTPAWFERVSLIEQAPYILPGITVREALQFSLSLRNERCGTQDTLKTHENLLESLHLTKILDTRMSVISSGEKQRTTIAGDLLAGKDILIMDEPTADLDSHIALNLIVFLKKLAVEESKMIILTIHQPSDQIVKLFDNVLLMHKGTSIYSGSLRDLSGFLEDNGIHKPDDWTMSDFVFEAFYNDSRYKVVNEQKEKIANLLNKIRSDSEVRTRSVQASNKSTKFVNFVPRMSQVFIILRRAAGIFFTPAFYMRLFLVVSFDLIFSISMLMNDKPATVESLDAFVTSFFPAKPQTPLSTRALALIESLKPETPTWDILSQCSSLLNKITLISSKILAQNILLVFMGSNILNETSYIFREISLGYYRPASFVTAFFILEFFIYSIYAALCVGIHKVTMLDKVFPLEPLRVAGSLLLTTITTAVFNSLVYSLDISAPTRLAFTNLAYTLTNISQQYSKLLSPIAILKPQIIIPILVAFLIIEIPLVSVHFSTFINSIVMNGFEAELNKKLELVDNWKDVIEFIKKNVITSGRSIYATATSYFAGKMNMGIITGVLSILLLVISFALLCRAFTTRVSL